MANPAEPGVAPKIPTVALWILGGLPLMIYPMVAIASVMSLAAYVNPDGPGVTLISRGFQLTSLAYPLVFVGAGVVAAAFKWAGNAARSRQLAWLPLGYLVLVMILFVGWMTFGA